MKSNRNLMTTRNLFPSSSLLDDFFNGDWPALNWGSGPENTWVPAANVVEKEKSFEVELSVPGYEKKDIQVEVDSHNVLHINGEREDEVKEEKEDYTRREFSYGSFTRSFQLPETVDDEQIAAKCKNGVLKLELPKKDTALLKKKTKAIDIA